MNAIYCCLNQTVICVPFKYLPPAAGSCLYTMPLPTGVSEKPDRPAESAAFFKDFPLRSGIVASSLPFSEDEAAS